MEETKHSAINISYFSAEVGSSMLSAGTKSMGVGITEGFKSTGSIVSNTLTQINRYTPDIYDVGQYGKKDLTSDAGMFIAGNSAMIAQNLARMGRTPLAFGLEKATEYHYRKDRLDKIKENSSLAKEKLQSKGAYLSYTEIATGVSRKDVLTNNDRYIKNRYIGNTMQGKGLKEKGSVALDRFKSNKYDRVLSHQNGMKQYTAYLRKNQFSLKRSAINTYKNQTRKFKNQIINGNDSSGTANKAVFAMNKTVEGSAKLTIQAYKRRAQIKHFFSVIRHPVKSLKALGAAIISALTGLISLITTIPVIVSVIAALIPLIIIAVCVCVVISTIVGWFTLNNSYKYQDIKLCDVGNTVKDIANVSAITDKSSEQWKLFNENKYGTVKYDSWGLAYVEQDGKKWYCNAMATYYTNTIGDKFRITLDNGTKIYIIICDIKANKHTHKGNNDSSKACLSADGSMLEFYGDVDNTTTPLLKNAGFGSINNNLDSEHMWKGAVTKVESAYKGGSRGSINGDPDFTNTDAWKTKNPYAPSLYGQCTWFAWGRFYEVYGYDPGFSGNGYQCVRELLNAHGDKFKYSTIPKAGAIGSSDKEHNHVWFVQSVDGNNVTVQEGNLDGKTNDWDTAIKDWHTVTYTIAQLRSYYGNISFAVPK